MFRKRKSVIGLLLSVPIIMGIAKIYDFLNLDATEKTLN